MTTAQRATARRAAKPRDALRRGASAPAQTRARSRPAASAAPAARNSSSRSTGRSSAARTGASRCAAPTASWEGTGVFAQETVDRFDRELDRGTRELTDDPRARHARLHGGRARAVRPRARDRPDPALRLLRRARAPRAARCDRVRRDRDARTASRRERHCSARRAPSAISSSARRWVGGHCAGSSRFALTTTSTRVGARLLGGAGRRRSARRCARRPRAPRSRAGRAATARASARARGSAAASPCRRAGRCRGACRCARSGPVTSSTSSSSWKASPIAWPNGPSGGPPPASAPSSQAAPNRRAVFSSQRAR